MADPGSTEGSGSERPLQALIRDLAEGISAGQTGASPVPRLDPVTQSKLDDDKSNRGLREKYARWIMALLGFQIGVADVIFFLYANWGVSWHIPAAIMGTWLSSIVVQVIGVVLVVTKGLFQPPK